MTAQSRRRRDCGVWEALRPLKRSLLAKENHPHYVGNNNESLRLDQVIKATPPEGGMAAYIAAMDATGSHPSQEE